MSAHSNRKEPARADVGYVPNVLQPVCAEERLISEHVRSHSQQTQFGMPRSSSSPARPTFISFALGSRTPKKSVNALYLE